MEPGGEGAVRPPVQRRGAIRGGSSEGGGGCEQRRGTEKEGALLVLLENLLGQARVAG